MIRASADVKYLCIKTAQQTIQHSLQVYLFAHTVGMNGPVAAPVTLANPIQLAGEPREGRKEKTRTHTLQGPLTGSAPNQPQTTLLPFSWCNSASLPSLFPSLGREPIWPKTRSKEVSPPPTLFSCVIFCLLSYFWVSPPHPPTRLVTRGTYLEIRG